VDRIRLSTGGGATRQKKALVIADEGAESFINGSVVLQSVVVMHACRISAIVVFNALYGNTLGKIGFEAVDAYLHKSL
jgi:hypothetical protein